MPCTTSSLRLVFCLCHWLLTSPISPFFTYLCVCGMYFKHTTTNVPETWHSLLAHMPTCVLYLQGWCHGESPQPVPPKFNLFLQWTYWIYSFVRSCIKFFWIVSIYPINKQVLAISPWKQFSGWHPGPRGAVCFKGAWNINVKDDAKTKEKVSHPHGQSLLHVQ